MSAGVVQLTARGIQDAYLNGKPDVSYFVGVYRRHSQFALQTSEYPFDSQVNFGDSAKVKIPYKGDLVLGTSLKVTLPALTQSSGSGWAYPDTITPTFTTNFSDGYSKITTINETGSYTIPNTFSITQQPVIGIDPRIAYGDGYFVTVSFDNISSYSPDGHKWTLGGTVPNYTEGRTYQPWVPIAYGGGYFVSAGYSSTSSPTNYSSDHGITWKPGGTTGLEIISIAYGDGYFVALSNNRINTTYSSDHGQNWTPGSIQNQAWNGIAYGGGYFVAVSADGYCSYSSDHGQNWTPGSIQNHQWSGIAYGGGYFVAVSGKYSAYSAYSSDYGQTWTLNNPDNNFSYNLAYGGGYFVAVSVYNRITLTSNYGQLWSVVFSPITLICTSFTNQQSFYNSNPYVSIQTPPTINIGDTITGLPYAANVYSTITGVTINNKIYYKFSVILSNSQTISPITTPITISVSGVTMNVISASTLNWVNDDLMYQQLDFANHINFRSLYPAIQTYTNLYLPVDLPLPGTNIPTIVSAGTVMSGFTNYSLTFGSLYGAFYTTPIRVNSGELFRTPLPVTISNFGTATANTSCNPSSLDFSNSYVELSNIKFNLTNLSIQGVGNVTGQLSSTLLTIPASLQPLYTVFTMDTTVGLQNLANFDWLQVPYGYQYTGGDYVPGTTVSLYYGATVIATAVAYVHTVDTDDFGSIPLPQGTVFVVVGQVSFVPLTPIYGLSVGAAVSGPGHMQFIYSLACTRQPVLPITSPASATLDNGYDSGTVNFVSYTPIYQTSLEFPSDAICTFWGFDPSTLSSGQIIPPTSTQRTTQFNSFPVSTWSTLQSGWVSGTGIQTASYVNCVGTALINTAEFLIGGQLIESLTGEYIQNAIDLKTPLQNKPALTIIYGKDDSSPAYAPRTYIIPLPFYFYRETGLAVPLVSLYRQDVEVRFTFNYAGLNANSGNSINIQPYVNVPADSLQVSLVVDYAFLTGPELDYFRNKKLDYLITQVQLFQQILPINSIGGTYTVYFVNPVIELQVLIRNNANIPDYFDYSNNGLQNMALYFNGQTVFSAEAVNDTYLGTMEILNKHRYVSFAKGTTSSNVYVYSFSTNPDTPTVPSGHVNMSRIKQQVLEVNLTPDAHQKQLSIYAINYNMLRVQFGLGGLLFNSSQ